MTKEGADVRDHDRDRGLHVLAIPHGDSSDGRDVSDPHRERDMRELVMPNGHARLGEPDEWNGVTDAAEDDDPPF